MRSEDDGTRTTQRSHRGFTRSELLAVLAVVGLMAALAVVPGYKKLSERSRRISCVGRLKNIGLGLRIFRVDHTNRAPHEISTNGGGTREWALDPVAAWRHFSVLSNELSTPLILQCPADRERPAATRFASFTNNHGLSYFLGLNASPETPESLLGGDRNLVLEGRSLGSEVVEIVPGANLSFDRRMHRFRGNLLFGDASVQQLPSGPWTAIPASAGAKFTNVLVIP